jgi:putative YhdH/YhfP family quinone oxidoreductase
VGQRSFDELPGDGVLIRVAHSSVNFKDGLATTVDGKVARISPIIPGIDLAGTIVDLGGGAAEDFSVGDQVIAHGYDLGVSRHGGYAEFARVPADWLVSLPEGMSTADAMTIGTAGFTAALSVVSLEHHGLQPDDGPVLVTGATGGVGSLAVTILAGRGYEVTASTGKPGAHEYLTALGATHVVDRSELCGEVRKPLGSMHWAGAVDCVGGNTLANVLAQVQYGGAVAASGLTGGATLPVTVLPFILRSVSLVGIDSVQVPIERRREVWARLGDDLRPLGLQSIGRSVGLDGVGSELDAILRGDMTGRVVVDLAHA